MKMKSAIFPTVLAIALAIAGLGIPIPGTTGGTPWLVAYHMQTLADGQQEKVDNLIIFLWGQQYTVVGTKNIQTHYTPFDWRDFPFYSMIGIILSIISGILALISSRGTYVTIKGREMRIRGMFQPLPLLFLAMMLVALSALYLYVSASTVLVPSLENNNYVASFSYGLQFMAASALAYLVSLAITYRNFLRSKREEATRV